MKELVIDMPTKEQAQTVLGQVMVRAMQHNYCDLMKAHGDADRVNEAMQRLFGDSWLKARENIYQWYDKEVTGEVL